MDDPKLQQAIAYVSGNYFDGAASRSHRNTRCDDGKLPAKHEISRSEGDSGNFIYIEIMRAGLPRGVCISPLVLVSQAPVLLGIVYWQVLVDM